MGLAEFFLLFFSSPVVLLIALVWTLESLYRTFRPETPDRPEFRIRRFYVTDRHYIAEVEA